MKSYPTNMKEIIEKVASIAANAALVGLPLTAEYVSYMANCSVRFASAMLQYWDGAGRPICD